MSYVAITGALTEKVARAINKMCERELASEAQKPTPNAEDFQFFHSGKSDGDTGRNNWLERTVWRSLYGTVAHNHPDLMMTGQTEVRFRIADRTGDGTESTSGYDILVKLDGIPIHRVRTALYNNDLTVEVKVAHHPAFEAYAQWFRADAECRKRWGAIREQVVGFLKSAKSLNEALKLWPDLRRYVPAEYLKRADAKAPKPEKTMSDAVAKLAAMDLEMIESSTVLSRMSGSKT